MEYSYLAHHGIKGQKWGIRRYQNPDGTLTDEGRRRYGYGKGADTFFTENTKSHIKRGAKIGGLAKGGIAGAASAVMGYSTATSLASLGVATLGGPIGAAAMSAGAAFILNGAVGAVQGAAVGGIIGAATTAHGRRYIETYDRGLADFENRERRQRNGNISTVRMVGN